MDIKQEIVSLSKKTWAMDTKALIKKIIKLYNHGVRGFIIPLTLGYSLTGTNDPYKEICSEVQTIKTKLKNSQFFIWIDAAMNGLTMPFTSKNFIPFNNKLIEAFSVSFHKCGFNPYPAGITLYQRQNRKLIERDINYLNEKDNTLIGSRSGIPSVAVWAIINKLGKNGFKKRLNSCLKNKNKLTNELKRFSDLKIINDKNSLIVSLILLNNNNSKLKKIIENKLGARKSKVKIRFTDETKKLTIYRLFFRPNITTEKISKYLEKLKL
jgi:glutamate/tyrosine decarboxylase-like PLP-dependent enzyme